MFLSKNKEQIKISAESFSATDYSVFKGDEKGIVFPYSEKKIIENEIICSSIINHRHTETCLIKHSEIRLVKCKNQVLTYQQIPTIGVEILPNTDESLSELFSNNSSNFIMEVNIPNKTLAFNVNTDKLQPFIEIYNKFNAKNYIDISLVKEKQKVRLKHTEYYTKFFGSPIHPFDHNLNQITSSIFEDFPNKGKE